MILDEEGLDNVWARHAALAGAVWAAVEAWSAGGALALNIAGPGDRSHAVTTVRTGAGDAARLRRWCETQAGLTLGVGLAGAGERDDEPVPHRPHGPSEPADAARRARHDRGRAAGLRHPARTGRARSGGARGRRGRARASRRLRPPAPTSIGPPVRIDSAGRHAVNAGDAAPRFRWRAAHHGKETHEWPI